MTKGNESRKYAILLEMLLDKRENAKLSQRQLAERLGKTQSWICRHEKGDLRMDYVELRTYLQALDTSILSFVKALEKKIAQEQLD